MRALAASALILSLSGLAFPATLNVPGDHATIQGAIAAAGTGDTVMVHPGTYLECLVFMGKAVTVKSAQGPGVTVIDGLQAGSVVTFKSGEGSKSILDGFTITNGSGTLHSAWQEPVGGGIFIDNDSNPTLLDNVITGNTLTTGAQNFGGGIYCGNSSPLISGNTITENHVLTGGGGMVLEYSNATVEGNTITLNTAETLGGGIYCFGFSSPTITNNVISENAAVQSCAGGLYMAFDCSGVVENNTITNNRAFHGAGVFCAENAGVTFSGNLISENECDTYGGGFYLIDDSPVIVGNTISLNRAAYGGGGMAVTYASTGSDPEVDGNLVVENRSGTDSGGGISIFRSSGTYSNNVIALNSSGSMGGGGIGCTHYASPVLRNNTVFRNRSKNQAGGIQIADHSTVQIINTLFREDEVTYWGPPEIGVGKSSVLTISHCDVAGGKALVKVATSGTLNWGPGMIDEDPRFADAESLDLHLTWTSPCINRGTDVGAPVVDMDGDLRPWMGTTDMGVDEFMETHPLEALNYYLSWNQGGQIKLGLSAGAGNAGRWYILLGSVSGNAPGLPLPGGHATLAVNWDAFTDQMLNYLYTPALVNFLGTLDWAGCRSATFDTLGPLPPSAQGLVLSLAFAVSNPWDFASNPVAIYIL
jgi:hypothetical protein